MGFWKEVTKFASKQAERVMLVVSGMQWGDSNNDQEKVTKALTVYENNRSVGEKLYNQEQTKSLEYTVIGLIIVVVLFMMAICFKVFAEVLKKKQSPPSPTIALTTLRNGNQTIPATNSSNVNCA